MTAPLLLHVTTGPDWRAALDDGVLRAPSLVEQGFLHLSTPEQVALPANRLFPGREDLVLLCVDPGRLAAEVRWEPGVPGDPASMRFPHLYGPLPTAAVVAVLPWPPGPDGVFTEPIGLPEPDDVAARALALTRSFPRRRAAHLVDVRGGVAVLDPRHPLSHEHNRLLVAGVGAEEVVADAQAVLGGAGLGHRSVLTPDAALAEALGARGWGVEPLLVMAGRPTPTRDGGAASVVAQPVVHPLWRDGWARAGFAPEVGDALVAREPTADDVLRVRDVAVLVDGVPVAAAQLRGDGATAALEAVMTHPEHRGRGHADAVLARALEVAVADGADVVVLEAAERDWPRHWYARRGFAEVGRVWECSLV